MKKGVKKVWPFKWIKEVRGSYESVNDCFIFGKVIIFSNNWKCLTKGLLVVINFHDPSCNI